MKKYIAIFCEEENLFNKYKAGFDPSVNLTWLKASIPVEEQISEDMNIEAMIVNPPRISNEIALKIPGLKLIQVTSAGTNLIDIITLNENGIRVSNNNGGNSVAVAEHTIAMMISVFRNLPKQYADVKNGEWQSDSRKSILPSSHDLSEKKIGIVGLGHIGKKVAKRLIGWDSEVVYNDILKQDKKTEEELNIKYESFENLLKTSDIITLHVPLNNHTKGMISSNQFKQMKPNSIIINCCRGAVINEKDLINALENNYISGAGLDVLEEEPTPINNPLIKMNNVVITPHLASISQESNKRSLKFAIDNTTRLYQGEEPISVIFPE